MLCVSTKTADDFSLYHLNKETRWLHKIKIAGKHALYSCQPYHERENQCPSPLHNLSGPFLNNGITGFVTRITRRMSLVEQELLTLQEHLSSSPVFSVVRVTRSLVLCVCSVDRCLSFCTFLGHCVVCSSGWRSKKWEIKYNFTWYEKHKLISSAHKFYSHHDNLAQQYRKWY
jgi:hypothetical protein